MDRLIELKLTLIQWGLVLRAIKAEQNLCREAAGPARPTDMEDLRELTIIEGKVIDLAF